MRLEIASKVFANANYNLQLLHLLQLSMDGFVYLSPRSRTATDYIKWLNSLDRITRSKWETMIDWSERDLSLFRMWTATIDDVAISNVGRTSVLSVADATQLVRSSYDILLENGRNDRAFLLAMAGESARNYLLCLEDRCRLRFDRKGGITEMKAFVEEMILHRKDKSIKYFAVFDSDSDAPGYPSNQAVSLISVCQNNNIPYHCLSKRAIENYLPIASLFDHAHKSSRALQSSRRELAQLYKGFTQEQKAHFPLKTGLPFILTGRQKALYASIVGSAKIVVANSGFSDDLSQQFKPPYHTGFLNGIEGEAAKDEVRKVIDLVLYYARGPL